MVMTLVVTLMMLVVMLMTLVVTLMMLVVALMTLVVTLLTLVVTLNLVGNDLVSDNGGEGCLLLGGEKLETKGRKGLSQ